ncbi:cast multi-domain protein [Stylonychia lemnae]|uniref:Cast multi-domain protein n=1 Tax=Stylonychia lemnae TaxID=5949 RepID=A0A077ZXS6_STYLE|nr:cast multi-domain protein [Stylonychia lemnae]|eukprot:CDW74382.1 cast multi-domain protein [Stylonychia lemnae]
MSMTDKNNSSSRVKLKSLSVLLAILGISSIQAVDYTCDPGNFLKDGKFCQPCRPGYYCTGGVITYMKKCSPGFYTTYGASVCAKCPAGFSCSDPTQPPEACPPMKYSVEGSSSCSLCPQGSVCNANGVVTACNPGEICRSDDFTEKEPCPRGHKCPFPDQPDLIIECPAGTYAAENSTSCTLCSPGYSCPLGSSAPFKCPAGTFADEAGLSSCKICTQDYYCDGVSPIRYRCELGQYSSEGASACTDCPAGFYCPPESEPTYPIICEKGYYSTGKASICYPCPEGYECQDRKSLTKCADGFYSLAGNDACIQCPPGYECGSWGTPMPCSPGQYSLPGQKQCTYCPLGNYCQSTKALPAQCQLGYYQDELGKAYCKECPDGFTCVDQTIAPVQCPSGQFTDKYHQQCYQCPAGYDCSKRKYEEIFFCGKGQYSLAGDVVCKYCPSGYFCERPDIDKQECPVGTYSIEGQVTCTECPLGYQCLDKQGKYIVKCLEGEYFDSVTKTCTECPKGYACPVGAATAGFDVMIKCDPGTYSIGGQTACTICPPGKYCPDFDKATVKDCPDGYISFGSASQCQGCPKNYECPTKSSLALCPTYFYSDENNNTCKPCPDGFNCMYPNATFQLWCPAGYYMQTLDWTCQICPIGAKCPKNSTNPTYCEHGQYSDMMGSVECKTCPVGYFSKFGSEFCQPTPPGASSPKGVYHVCQEGTYSDWGFSYCKICEPGFLCPKGSMIGMALSCPKGSYCIEGVQYKCKQGYFGIAERASTEQHGCAVCPAGFFCLDGTDNFELNPCPRGHYCPIMTGLPIECPQGTYNDQLYKRTIADCQQCPMGHQCANATKNLGEICQEGYYCPLGSYPGQYPCPAGTFGGYRTGLKDASECQICPAGYYCPEGTVNPIPSKPGQYQPYSSIGDEQALLICPPKYYCPNSFMTNYKGYHCQPGYYCPAGSVSPTDHPCPEGTYSDSHEIFDQSQCLSCPRGFKCGQAAYTNSNFTNCPRNEYCPLRTRASDTYLCPAGSYAPYLNSKSLDDCIVCPFGYYCLSGKDPVICPEGNYCPNGTQFDKQYPCPAGSYLDYTGGKVLGECKPCGLGNYCPEGSIRPILCEPGYYNDFSNEAKTCKKCDPGRYCPLDGTISQPLCIEGKYSGIQATKCTYCEVGHYCPNKGTTENEHTDQLCPVGVYCFRKLVNFNDLDEVTQQTEIINGEYGLNVHPNLQDHSCAVGFYCPAGTQKMIACPIGTYNRLKGRKSILDCQKVEGGYYVDEEASSTWSGECDPGHYCPDGSSSAKEVECPKGTYRAINRGSEPKDCSICPSGSYCDDTAMFQPKTCPVGFYCPIGTVVPEPCPEGTYGGQQGLTDSKSCTLCPSGYYCPQRGQTSASLLCDEGYLCIKGSRKPEPTDNVTGSLCPAGGYCPQGAQSAKNCSPGTYNMFEGGEVASDCQQCLPGYYCLGSNSAKPTDLCPAGYYCPAGTSKPTLKAKPGNYTPKGSSVQYKCQRGTYSPAENQSSCTYCPAGKFCPNQMMTTTQNCPMGHYCPSYQYFVENNIYYDKLKCPSGTYHNLTDQKNITACLPCPTGKFCAGEGLDKYNGSCSEGFYCNKYAESPTPSNESAYGYFGPCKAGYYCPAETPNPKACPIGTFSILMFACLVQKDITVIKKDYHSRLGYAKRVTTVLRNQNLHLIKHISAQRSIIVLKEQHPLSNVRLGSIKICMAKENAWNVKKETIAYLVKRRNVLVAIIVLEQQQYFSKQNNQYSRLFLISQLLSQAQI